MHKAKDFDNLPEDTPEIEGIEKPKPTIDFLDEYIKSLGDGTQKMIGIETGLAKLDQATLGLDGLVVLGGIPGKGKTSLALQLAFDACEKGTPILFYSLEMPRRAIYTKILNRLAEVKFVDILLKGRPYLEDTKADKNLLGEEDLNFYKYLIKEEVERLREAKKRLAQIGNKFYVRSRERGDADINFETVEQEINLIKAQYNSDKIFVIIDHLQVFNIEKYRDQIDKEGQLIDGFKGISERTDAVILLISQKNKAGFTQSGLQTIKGSVNIVYLADIVMFLDSQTEKDNRKNKGSDEDVLDVFGGSKIEPTDLIIAKNRYNAPTTIKLDFNGEYSVFTERKD